MIEAEAHPGPASHNAADGTLPRGERHSSFSVVRHFLLLFLALAIGVTWASHESFFGTATYEEGDDAANALQIEHARHFRELHGNYSRWNFHHPGPAFFYADAAGEWLLHDVAKIAPAPHNAHVYTSTLVQLAFYAAALALVARRSRQPWVVAALGIAAAAWHYPHAERVIFSVWPPDVLVMPFLCFVVACAATAAGERAALPILAIAGGFLVHGHIAQPLFVVPLSLLAVLAAWRFHWRGKFGQVVRSRPGIASLGLLALFLLPLVIDLTAGRASNAHDVLLHLRFETDHGQTLWQSVLCYASYFLGLNDPTEFNQLTPESYAVFRDGKWVLIAWAALLVLALWRLFRPAARRGGSDGESFGRWLFVFWLGASALTLVWGMRQDGGFTNFNSQFNHSLVHIVLVIGIVAIAEWLPPVPRVYTIPAFVAAVATFVLALPYDLMVGSRGDEVEVRVTALLEADPRPTAPKLLEFGPNDWYETVTLARALQRRGIDFYVASGWRIMFGAHKVFANQNGVLDHGGVSVWRVFSPKEAPSRGHAVNRDARLVFRTPPAVELPIKVSFSESALSPLAVCGVGGAEGDWAWSDGHVAAFEFVAPRTEHDLVVTLDASGLVSPLTPRGQRIALRVNGAEIGKAAVGEDRQIIRCRVPREAWNRRSPQMIVIEMPDAIAPADTGASGDRRVLALQLHRLTVDRAP